MDSWMARYVLRIDLKNGTSELVERDKVKRVLESLERQFLLIAGDRDVWRGRKYIYVSLG